MADAIRQSKSIWPSLINCTVFLALLWILSLCSITRLQSWSPEAHRLCANAFEETGRITGHFHRSLLRPPSQGRAHGSLERWGARSSQGSLDKGLAGQVPNTWAGGVSRGPSRHGWSEGWFSPVLRMEAVCFVAEGGRGPAMPLAPD